MFDPHIYHIRIQISIWPKMHSEIKGIIQTIPSIKTMWKTHHKVFEGEKSERKEWIMVNFFPSISRYRDLRCLRNTIHANLFLTYILSALLWIIPLLLGVCNLCSVYYFDLTSFFIYILVLLFDVNLFFIWLLKVKNLFHCLNYYYSLSIAFHWMDFHFLVNFLLLAVNGLILQ